MSSLPALPGFLLQDKPSQSELYAMIGLALVRAVEPDVSIPSDFIRSDTAGVNQFVRSHLDGQRQTDASPEAIEVRRKELTTALERAITDRMAAYRQRAISIAKNTSTSNNDGTGPPIPPGTVLPFKPCRLGRFYREGQTEVTQPVFVSVDKFRCLPDLTWSESNDFDKRHTYGPKWVDNSCAVDSVFVLMLCMNAGVLQYDQMPYGTVSTENPFQLIARVPWEALGDDRSGLLQDFREICLNEYLKVRNTGYEEPIIQRGDFLSADNVMGWAIEGLPQTTWWTQDIWSCEVCGEVVDLVNSSNQESELFLHLPTLEPRIPEEFSGTQVTIGLLIQAYFDYKSTASASRACPNATCSARVHHLSAVIGSLPPRLWVNPGHENCFIEGFFDFDQVEISYTALPTTGRCYGVDVIYRLRGFIEGDQNHFVTYWRDGATTFYKWDSLDNEGNRGRLMELSDILKGKKEKVARRMGLRSAATENVEPNIAVLLFERIDCFSL